MGIISLYPKVPRSLVPLLLYLGTFYEMYHAYHGTFLLEVVSFCQMYHAEVVSFRQMYHAEVVSFRQCTMPRWYPLLFSGIFFALEVVTFHLEVVTFHPNQE